MRGKPQLIKLTDATGGLKSPYWYIHYYDGRSKRISTGCLIGTQDHDANIALSAFTLERERPAAREPDRLMVAQALRDYYNEHAQFTATAKHFLYHEKRLKEHFGVYFISQITPATIGAYIRKCEERRESTGTIRRDLEMLKAALNHEVNERRLIYAPKIKMPPPPAPKEKFLSQAEQKKLLVECKNTPHLEAFVRIMLATGQRPGAVENLKWFQVDFKERLIRFDLYSKHDNKRARSVPINQQLMALLKRLHKAKQTEYVLEYKGEHAGNVKKSFARACKDAGVDASRYTLRHTFGTESYLAGHSEKDISDIMGHTTAKTTSRHYIKTDMDRLRKVVESAQKVRKQNKGGKK